jgi:hypothetical protein
MRVGLSAGALAVAVSALAASSPWLGLLAAGIGLAALWPREGTVRDMAEATLAALWPGGMLIGLTVATIPAALYLSDAGIRLWSALAPQAGQWPRVEWQSPVRLLAGAASPVPCQFVRGFALLTAWVGPSIVGTCVEDEHANPASGTVEQRTTGGLLVWRIADNGMGFTDGYQTWVYGPQGLQWRLNIQRYCWEFDAPPGRCLR